MFPYTSFGANTKYPNKKQHFICLFKSIHNLLYLEIFVYENMVRGKI